MSKSVVEKRAAFRTLHETGCFILANPWDIGSARLFESLGFRALASTSTGFAWTVGKADYAVTRDEVLRHLSALCESVDLPVNADFESAFASDLHDVAINVGLAVETGVAGLSIEDRSIGSIDKLYETSVAVDRVRAARSAIDRTGKGVILVARTEGLLMGGSVTDAIDRLVAFADAGADCLYAPGIGMAGLSSKSDVISLVKAVAPKPVNILVVDASISFTELADAGVRRISVGGALVQVGWRAVFEAAKQLSEGRFEGLETAFPNAKLNELFAKRH